MLEVIVKQLITTLKPLDDPKLIYMLNYGVALREFRTIGLGVPRRSGKTTLLESLHKSRSSLLWRKNTPMSNILPSMRGHRQGLKYGAILLDEYKEVPDVIYEYAEELRREGFAETDLFILNLYT